MTTDNIARADEIVGLTENGRHWTIGVIQAYADDIRRSRYIKWLDANPSSFSFRDDLARLAAAVVAAHAAKRPQPSDGLPPGPWKVVNYQPHRYSLMDANTVTVAWTHADPHPTWLHRDHLGNIYAYLARCGSPAVRSILAACDDAELERWAKVIAEWRHDGGTFVSGDPSDVRRLAIPASIRNRVVSTRP